MLEEESLFSFEIPTGSDSNNLYLYLTSQSPRLPFKTLILGTILVLHICYHDGSRSENEHRQEQLFLPWLNRAVPGNVPDLGMLPGRDFLVRHLQWGYPRSGDVAGEGLLSKTPAVGISPIWEFWREFRLGPKFVRRAPGVSGQVCDWYSNAGEFKVQSSQDWQCKVWGFIWLDSRLSMHS